MFIKALLMTLLQDTSLPKGDLLVRAKITIGEYTDKYGDYHFGFSQSMGFGECELLEGSYNIEGVFVLDGETQVWLESKTDLGASIFLNVTTGTESKSGYRTVSAGWFISTYDVNGFSRLSLGDVCEIAVYKKP